MDLPSLIALMATVPYVGPALPYVPLVCGLAAILDAVMPPPDPASAWMPLRKLLHIMALNVGNARNAMSAGPAGKTSDAAQVSGEPDQPAIGKAGAAM